MVIGHAIDQGIKRNFIFSFHMPLFIMISGIKEFLKNTKKLIIPYLITIFIVDILKYCLINNAYSFVEVIIMYLKQIMLSYSYLKIKTSILPVGILWFIPLLIGIRIIFMVLKRILKDNDFVLTFFSILVSYWGYIISIKGYWLPFSIDVAMATILFYYFGYILNKYKLLDNILKNKILLIVMFVIWLITIKFGNIEIAVRKYPGGLYCFIGAICECILIMKFSNIIEKNFQKLGDILSWYGKIVYIY